MKVILVAPWIDPHKEFSRGMFDFSIDTKLDERTEIDIFYGPDDSESCVKSAQIIIEAFPKSKVNELSGREHFCVHEFPELLEVIIDTI